jgi:hypothetical protein
MAGAYCSDSSILPEELATQSVRLKEEQLRREEEKLREIELKVQREINEKRQELLAKEESLRSVYPIAAVTVGVNHIDISGTWKAASPLKARRPNSGINRHDLGGRQNPYWNILHSYIPYLPKFFQMPRLSAPFLVSLSLSRVCNPDNLHCSFVYSQSF